MKEFANLSIVDFTAREATNVEETPFMYYMAASLNKNEAGFKPTAESFALKREKVVTTSPISEEFHVYYTNKKNKLVPSP